MSSSRFLWPFSRLSIRRYNSTCTPPHLQYARAFDVLGRGYRLPDFKPEDKIFIALSSGVDSSVVAGLLVKELKHPIRNLHPFYIVNWNPADTNVRDLSSLRQPPRKKPSLLKLLPKPTTEQMKCTSREFRHVQDLCKVLGLRKPLELNLEKDYWHEVFMPMLDEYRIGRTPNPDVSCNRFIKFGKVMDRLEREVQKIGLEKGQRWWVATGHYASIGYCEATPRSDPHLLRSRGPNKDQTFYLSTVPSIQLSRLLFPLSFFRLRKKEVYDFAKEWSLPGWVTGEPERSESMGLCFVEPGGGYGNASFRLFLNEFLPPCTGNIIVGPEIPPPERALTMEHVDKPKNTTVGTPPSAFKKNKQNLICSDVGERTLRPGTIIGRHDGLWTATIGEKAHLDVPQGDRRYQGRWYISRKFPERNEIEVVRGWWNGRLWGWGVIVKIWYWLGKDCEEVAKKALAKKPHDCFSLAEDTPQRGDHSYENPLWNPGLVAQFRHRQQPIEVKYIQIESTLGCFQKLERPLPVTVHLTFATPQRAITHGQNIALWWQERCLGGGTINEILWEEGK